LQADSRIELLIVQLPGRENRFVEPPLTSMAEVTAALLPALRPWLDRPFAFFGHSLGALIAFETAHALRRDCGLEPTRIFASACRAPHAKYPFARIHDLPEHLLVRELVDRYNGIPQPILEDRDLLRLMLPMLRADVRILETYKFEPRDLLSAPVSAFGGSADRTVSRDSLELWRDVTRGGFVLRMVSGDHFFLQTAKQDLLGTVAADLFDGQCFEKAVNGC
jgi:medium-chain acyl-[acyl-carrier-protein] hydrolase